jgi:hypothetical protein
VQNSENCKKGECPEDHLGIKNRIKKIPVDQFPPKNVTLKNRHIDIIAPNFTNFYRPLLPFPSRLENKKDKCSHLVIWTSTLSIIRIKKLFVIGN